MKTILSAILGLVMPISYTAPLYLRSRLQMHGVDLLQVPTACTRELAGHTVETTKLYAELARKNWRSEITANLETSANVVAGLMFGEPEIAQMSQPEIDAILSRYKLLGTLTRKT